MYDKKYGRRNTVTTFSTVRRDLERLVESFIRKPSVSPLLFIKTWWFREPPTVVGELHFHTDVWVERRNRSTWTRTTYVGVRTKELYILPLLIRVEHPTNTNFRK